MLQTHHILRVDSFTFTVTGAPWTDQQWGAQLILALVYRGSGWRGLVVLRSLIVGLSFWLIYRLARGPIGDPFTASLLTLGGFGVIAFGPGSLALRPQLFGLLLFALTMTILRIRTARPITLLWLVPVTVLWANIHGSFVLVPILVAAAFVDDLVAHRRQAVRTGLATIGTAILPLANPWGPGIYSYVVKVSSSPLIRSSVDEWHPLWREPVAGLAVLGGTAIVIIFTLRRAVRSPTLGETLGLIAFALLALSATRNLLFFGAFVPATIGPMLRQADRRSSEESRAGVVMAVSMTAMFAIGILRVALIQPSTDLLSQDPVPIASAVASVSEPGTHVFGGSSYSWLEFADPGRLQFTDDRLELFPTRLWTQYVQISDASPGWSEALDHWKVQVVAASYSGQAPLIAAISGDPSWHEVYGDSTGAVFVRAPSPGA